MARTSPGTIPGIEYSRSNISPLAAISVIDREAMPVNFPYDQWNDQQARYLDYWEWFRGEKLMQVVGKTKSGEPVLKFPLGINVVRTFSYKMASAVLGEEPYDSPNPMIKTAVNPKTILGKPASDIQKQTAAVLENAVNEVWLASNGRSLQSENIVLSQFLGGQVYQVCYEPDRDDLLFPVVVRSIPADFFLPVWRPGNYWDLTEAFVVYRIPAAAAKDHYGIEPSKVPYVIYYEHWKADTYSIFVDGKPLERTVQGKYGPINVVYKDIPNPFKKVPFVYIPKTKAGSDYGDSIVEAIRGLVLEFNARMADKGTSVKNNVNPRRYSRNLTQNPRQRQIGEGTWVTDLGQTNPSNNAEPEVWTDDKADIPAGVANYTTEVWIQLLREGNMNPVSFGEDEGSQRSGETLNVRMYPTTSHARLQRNFIGDGYNTIAQLIIQILTNTGSWKDLSVDAAVITEITKNARKWYSYSQAFLPQIPRDRSNLISEIILRLSQNAMSLEKAIDDFGDVKDSAEEINRIKEWLEFLAEVNVSSGPGQEGANASVPEPEATTKEQGA